jgi:hypothetical protein
LRTVRFFHENVYGVRYDLDFYDRLGRNEDGTLKVPPLPEGLEFKVVEGIEVDRGLLKMRGHLVNATGKDQEVALVDVSLRGSLLTPFKLSFSPEDKVSKRPQEGPPLPISHPRTFLLYIDMDTTIEFNGYLYLEEYIYEPGTRVTILWRFNLMGEEDVQGKVSYVLP